VAVEVVSITVVQVARAVPVAVVEQLQVQVAVQLQRGHFFTATQVVHQMELAVVAVAAQVKQDQLAVLEKVVTESRLQSLALLPFMAAAVAAVAMEYVAMVATVVEVLAL
jgi:hypothetical protein